MHVKKGDVLAVIDPSDAQLAVAQADANLRLAEQRVTQQFANVASAAAMVTQKRGDLVRAQIDYKRRNTLATTGAVSGDEMTASNNALETAQAALQQAEQQMTAQKAMIASGDVAHNPDVMAARVALDRAKLDLDRTVIRAPMDGIVAQNTAQVGQRVQAGAALMTVAPVAQAYVNANFKESQLEGVHPGPGSDADLRSLRLQCGVPRPCRGPGRRHRLGLLADPGAERDRQLDQGGAAPAGAHRARSQGTGRTSAARGPVDDGQDSSFELRGARWLPMR